MGHAEIQTTARQACEGTSLAGSCATAPTSALRPLGTRLAHPRPACGSRMTGDCHIRFCESRAVRSSPATHQTPQHRDVARSPPALPHALHADLLLLDQPGRTVLRLRHRRPPRPQRPPLRPGPRERHPRTDQSLKRQPQALHLDQIRRSDPGLTRATSSTNYWRRTLALCRAPEGPGDGASSRPAGPSSTTNRRTTPKPPLLPSVRQPDPASGSGFFITKESHVQRNQHRAQHHTLISFTDKHGHARHWWAEERHGQKTQDRSNQQTRPRLMTTGPTPPHRGVGAGPTALFAVCSRRTLSRSQHRCHMP